MTPFWTNASVKQFCPEGDPVARIQQSAESIALKAIDNGWSGPPYDPIQLAEHLGIRVLPKADLADARIVPTGNKLTIEFNPNRPPARVRFSIAHEIAHTLFPDCSDKVRNRSAGTGDDWQLEMLCNIGAATILLPLADIARLSKSSAAIDEVIELQRSHRVSVEAIVLRLAEISAGRSMAFSASWSTGDLTLDYMRGSARQGQASPLGFRVPAQSRLREIRAIGTKISTQEVWKGNPVSLEAVGVAGYPGQSRPRIVGLAHTSPEVSDRDLLTYRLGNAARPQDARPALICHVVNSRAKSYGGHGFVKSLSDEYPDAFDAYKEQVALLGRSLSLGEVLYTRPAENITVCNLVAQRGYGESKRPRISYEALYECLTKVTEVAVAEEAAVHMPRIGTGQAGGLWSVIEPLIRQTLTAAGCVVYVYDLPGTRVEDREPFQLAL